MSPPETNDQNECQAELKRLHLLTFAHTFSKQMLPADYFLHSFLNFTIVIFSNMMCIVSCEMTPENDEIGQNISINYLMIRIQSDTFDR